MKANKAKINYAVDIIITLGFLISAVSGIMLLFNVNSGYMGGRNIHYSSSLFLFQKYTWKEIHSWSSILMASGVLFHLILHWNWIVCMTRKIFKRERKQVRCVTL